MDKVVQEFNRVPVMKEYEGKQVNQRKKKARQDAAAASSEESAKEAVPMEQDRGIKRNEDDWTEFAMSLKKKAKQGPGEGEMELSAVDVVNWVNAVLEEGGPEEEEKAWE